MSSIATTYTALCSTCGVKPKQFGVLAGSAAAAIVILGTKLLVSPASAKAAPAPTPAPAGLAPAAPASPAATAAPLFAHGLPALNDELPYVRPARDPFVPRFAASSAQGGSESIIDRSAQLLGGSSAPNGVRLQATLNGSMGIINDNTYRVGDSFVDGEGRSYSVISIAERFAMVSDGAREWRLSLGATGPGPASR